MWSKNCFDINIILIQAAGIGSSSLPRTPRRDTAVKKEDHCFNKNSCCKHWWAALTCTSGCGTVKVSAIPVTYPIVLIFSPLLSSITSIRVPQSSELPVTRRWNYMYDLIGMHTSAYCSNDLEGQLGCVLCFLLHCQSVETTRQHWRLFLLGLELNETDALQKVVGNTEEMYKPPR